MTGYNLTGRTLALLFALSVVVAGLGASDSEAAFGDITFEGGMTLPSSVFITDVWGYYDFATQKEYAVVGDWNGKVYIVDVTNPSSMSLVSVVTSVPGFDVKVFSHYVYVCDGDASGIDSRIINISNPAFPVLESNTFASAHNIAIATNGYMYLEFSGGGAGLQIFNLTPNPTNPAFLFHDPGSGHDSTPHGNRLFDFRGSLGSNIYDITNPATPVLLGSITDPNIAYHHSGDVTSDGDFLWINDELATHPRPDVTIWDISNPGTPSKVAEIADTTATVHNAYIIGTLAFVAYYTAGFKVFDVSNPASPLLTDSWDTSTLSGEGFDGAFGVYPFAPSGNIYVSDIDNGLFVFSVEGAQPTPSGEGDTPSKNAVVLNQNVPNPFNPQTNISYQLASPGAVRLRVFNVRGQVVRTLVDSFESAGLHSVAWDGRDDNGIRSASGAYFYQLRAAGQVETRRMTLIK